MHNKQPIRLALVDDHTIIRKGLTGFIELMDTRCTILLEAKNGVDLQEKLNKDNEPDIILLDVSMPVMDGFETAKWLNTNFPKVKILVLTVNDDDESIERMLTLGVKGYLSKDIGLQELEIAINKIMNGGFYYADFIARQLIDFLRNKNDEAKAKLPGYKLLNDREKDFLQLACSDLTYDEIASQMFLSPKTIDGYRISLFQKLQVKSRVCMALYAVKHELVQL